MWGYNTTYHADPDELLGVVEARLQQLREVVVLGGADESGDGEAVEGARARVQVRQQDAERLAVELDHAELQTSGVSVRREISQDITTRNLPNYNLSFFALSE